MLIRSAQDDSFRYFTTETSPTFPATVKYGSIKIWSTRTQLHLCYPLGLALELHDMQHHELGVQCQPEAVCERHASQLTPATTAAVAV